MNNIEKKLDALIDALGFDVEITKDYKAKKLTKDQARRHFTCGQGNQSDWSLLKHLNGQDYVIDDDGMYLERLVSPNIDFKLTKRNKQ